MCGAAKATLLRSEDKGLGRRRRIWAAASHDAIVLARDLGHDSPGQEWYADLADARLAEMAVGAS